MAGRGTRRGGSRGEGEGEEVSTHKKVTTNTGTITTGGEGRVVSADG